MTEEQLTIGELAHRTGVATSALRYWEQLGLLAPPARLSGQRRYPPSAVGQVGEILLLRDLGYTLRDLKALLASRSSGAVDWRMLHQLKTRVRPRAATGRCSISSPGATNRQRR